MIATRVIRDPCIEVPSTRALITIPHPVLPGKRISKAYVADLSAFCVVEIRDAVSSPGSLCLITYTYIDWTLSCQDPSAILPIQRDPRP